MPLNHDKLIDPVKFPQTNRDFGFIPHHVIRVRELYSLVS
jgi:hypothetical protein